MHTEIEINGCVEIPKGTDPDSFISAFLRWLEENDCSFGGGFNTIIDGYYILPDGTRGKRIDEE